MTLRELAARDNREVFLNLSEFAEACTVGYDGKTYRDIPVLLSGAEQKARPRTVDDHVQGLYQVTDLLRCAAADLGGVTPERGQRLRVYGPDGNREYYVASSKCEMGMLRVELEAIDE